MAQVRDLAIVDVPPNLVYRRRSDGSWTVRQNSLPRRDLEQLTAMAAEDIRRRLSPADGDPVIVEVVEIAKRIQGRVRQLPPNQSLPGVVY